jgi:anti-sigma factor RsiW
MTDRDQWTARLSEYVDGELPADERVALERHLGECAACREVASELRQIREAAGALADVEPPRDLWPGIQQRMGGVEQTGRVLPFRRRWAFTVPQLAAAAILMMVVGAGAATVALRGNGTPVPSAGPAAVGALTIQPAAFPGTAKYDAAIADLERVLAEHRDDLDSTTIRVLEQSLAMIDRAIARARAALATDPGDPYLNEHLAETMRQKLNLMRRAATLAATS